MCRRVVRRRVPADGSLASAASAARECGVEQLSVSHPGFQRSRLLPLFFRARGCARENERDGREAADRCGRRNSSKRRRADIWRWPRPAAGAAARLIAVGGLSGSGKSTLARALAPSVGAVPGAVVLRSDEIRKQLCGVDLRSRLGSSGYSAEVTRRVTRRRRSAPRRSCAPDIPPSSMPCSLDAAIATRSSMWQLPQAFVRWDLARRPAGDARGQDLPP